MAKQDNLLPQPLQTSEPTDPKFFKEENLKYHAKKHVLDQKWEKWEKILGNDLVRSLRKNRADDEQMQKLLASYEWYISESAVSNGKENSHHFHTGRLQFKDDMSELFYSQEEIYGCTEENVFYLLSKSVRNKKNDLYNIVTAYKPYPKAKHGAKKLIYKDICNEIAKSSIYELANHWDKKDSS